MHQNQIYVYGDYLAGTLVAYNGTAEVIRSDVRPTGVFGYNESALFLNVENDGAHLRDVLTFEDMNVTQNCSAPIDARYINNILYVMDSISGTIFKRSNSVWEPLHE